VRLCGAPDHGVEPVFSAWVEEVRAEGGEVRPRVHGAEPGDVGPVSRLGARVGVGLEGGATPKMGSAVDESAV